MNNTIVYNNTNYANISFIMCLKCHSQIPTAEIVRQLHSTLALPMYEKWNSTSINHCIIAAYGFNGTEASEVALTILKNFYAYLQVNHSVYNAVFERNGFHECPTPGEIKILIDHIISVNEKNIRKSTETIHDEIITGHVMYNLPIEFKFKVPTMRQPIDLAQPNPRKKNSFYITLFLISGILLGGYVTGKLLMLF